MSVDKKVIADNVALNVIETKKFKTNYLSFNFVMPLERVNNGINALVPRVLVRGTDKHPDMISIKKSLDELYAASVEARVYKRGEYQICGISAGWLDDRFAIDDTDITYGTLGLVEEIIFEPYKENDVFSSSYTESEKSNLIDEIEALINNKTSYAIRRCQQEMSRDESFGISECGDIEDIKKITPESLYAGYNRLLRSARIEIFYVGRDGEKIEERLKTMFAKLERVPESLTECRVVRKAPKIRTVDEDCPVTQGKLSLGFRTGTVIGDSDYHAFPVFAELYGGSPMSKLFMNVREKLSLCYYCKAIPENIKGIMIVTSGIENENREQTQNEILLQLENIKKGDISDVELSSAKKSLINAYKELSDSPASLEAWFLTRKLMGSDDTPEGMMEIFERTTKEEVAALARKITLDTVYFMRGTLKESEVEDDE